MKALTEHYGGLRQVPKTTRQLQNSNASAHHQGGDKFNHHHYGPFYEKWLPPSTDAVALLEIGVLEGISCAVWSDFYANGQIFGIDIDLTSYERYLPTLLGKGALRHKNLTVAVLNSLNATEVDEWAQRHGPFDVIIDDGDHRLESIRKTFENFFPYLRENGRYFIEDNRKVTPTLLGLDRRHRFVKEDQIAVIVKNASVPRN